MSNFFSKLVSKIIHNDLAIDLGTMNTLIYAKGRGIVLEEPTVIATTPRRNKVIAIGENAKKMLGTNPGNIFSTRPMKNGAINNPFIVTKMLEGFMKTKNVSSPLCPMRPRVIVAVPSGLTMASRMSVESTVLQAGARSVRLVEEPLAAAIGAGMDISSSTGCMIVDIGGGTSEIAIVSLGNIVHCNSVNVAGDAFDEAIISHMKNTHNLSIGELTAENIKIEIGSAVPFAELGQSEKTMNVNGLMMKTLGNNLPGVVTITSEEIRQALDAPIKCIIDGIAKTLAACRPELAGNLVNNGMTLAGGSSLLSGLDIRLRKQFDMPVYRANEPKRCVSQGIGIMLETTNIFDDPQAEPVGNNVKTN